MNVQSSRISVVGFLYVPNFECPCCIRRNIIGNLKIGMQNPESTKSGGSPYCDVVASTLFTDIHGSFHGQKTIFKEIFIEKLSPLKSGTYRWWLMCQVNLSYNSPILNRLNFLVYIRSFTYNYLKSILERNALKTFELVYTQN